MLGALCGVSLGTYDAAAGEVQLFWGECLEKCHPGESGEHYMSAPTFMLTVSKDSFKTWDHINMTALSTKYTPDPEAFLPFNWFDNAAVLVPSNPTAVPERAARATDPGWGAGLVLVGSVHNYSKKPGVQKNKNIPQHEHAGVGAGAGVGAAYQTGHGSVCYHSTDHGRTLKRGRELVPPAAPSSQFVQIDEPQLG